MVGTPVTVVVTVVVTASVLIDKNGSYSGDYSGKMVVPVVVSVTVGLTVVGGQTITSSDLSTIDGDTSSRHRVFTVPRPPVGPWVSKCPKYDVQNMTIN